MKTWLEDNWLLKLNKLFEGTVQPSLGDERLKHLEVQARPTFSKFLRPDNVFEFPRLWQDYFNIYINYPETSNEFGSPYISCYEFTKALKGFCNQISKRGYIEEGNRLTDKQRLENDRLESAARVFYTNTMRCAIDLFKKLARDSIESYRVACENALATTDKEYRDTYSKIYYVNVSPADKEAYFEHYYGELEEELEDLYRDLANEEIGTISHGSHGVDEPEFYKTTFEIRHVGKTYIVYINTKSEFLQNGGVSDYVYPEKSYSTELGIRKRNINSNDLKKLENLYGCKSFITKMPALKDGESNGKNAEKNFCGKDQVQKFFEKNLYRRLRKGNWFFPITEDSYKRLISVPEVTTSEFPASEDSPHLVALNVATYTDDLFSDRLGGTLDIDDSGNLILRRESGGILSVQEARAQFRPFLKSDALYVVDSPSEKFNGPDRRGFLPIQVKYLGEYNNVLIGHMEVSRRLLRKFKEDLENGVTRDSPLVQDIIQLLIYSNYIIVVDSWDRYYLNAGPVVQDSDFKKSFKRSKKGDERTEYKEYTADFHRGENFKFTLRIPDIKIIDQEDEKMRKLKQENAIVPEIKAIIKK